MSQDDFLSSLEERLLIKPISELKNEKFLLDVCSNKIKFLTIVESMQGVLTNENVGTREKGIEFLSWVLSNLPKDLFKSNEVSVVVNFYCDCLKGHHTIAPAVIKGLNALIKMKNIMSESVLKIIVHLFQYVNCQTQLQHDRHNIYSLLQFVVENYFGEIKTMGPDFVFGLISFIEGESDPMCLLFLFNFLPLFLKNFDLGHLAEEIFEVLSCYFPIDLNHVEGDTLNTVREDLVHGLIRCLSANSILSEMSLNLIFEKLNTSLKMAKLDSYKLLQECCKTLNLNSLESRLNELWKCLVKDVLPGNDQQICDSGLLALKDIMVLLSSSSSGSVMLYTFLDDILTTVKSCMNKADENMFQPAIKVLLAVSSGSKVATEKILCFLKPYFVTEPEKSCLETKAILSSFLPFLHFFQNPSIIESSDTEIVSSYHALVDLYFTCSAMDHFEIRKLGFTGISILFFNLNKEYRKKLYSIICENIKKKDDVKTSKEFVDVWRLLAENNSSEILPDLDCNEVDESSSMRQMWALSLIADLPTFTSVIIPYFMKVVVSSKNYMIGLECLLNACKSTKAKESKDFYRLLHSEHNILEVLVCWRSNAESAGIREILLLSEIIALIVRNQSPATQRDLLNKFSKKFFDDLQSCNKLNDPGLSMEHTQNVILVEAIIGSLHQEISIPMISDWREILIELSLKSSEELIRLSASRLLATLANKLPEETLFIDGLIKNIFELLNGNSQLDVKSNAGFLFTWIVKGVLIGGGPSVEPLISTWFDLLGREDVGGIIADRFHMILEEEDLYLTLESHCNFRVLYRQRLFQNFPKLLKMYEESEGAIKENYLLALARLLQKVPVHLVLAEISSVITTLLRCLDSHKSDVVTSSLNILKALLESKEKIFSEQSHNFIPRFLSLAALDKRMKVRADALTCLYFYGFYPTVILLPNRHKVIRELECCLDDKKRLVRKEAVRARCRWFLVGAPGEDILQSEDI